MGIALPKEQRYLNRNGHDREAASLFLEPTLGEWPLYMHALTARWKGCRKIVTEYVPTSFRRAILLRPVDPCGASRSAHSRGTSEVLPTDDQSVMRVSTLQRPSLPCLAFCSLSTARNPTLAAAADRSALVDVAKSSVGYRFLSRWA